MAELLGGDRDLGGMLAAMTRLVVADAVEALARIEPIVAKVIVIQKQVSISRRSRSRNWMIAAPRPISASIPTDVVQMPARAITP